MRGPIYNLCYADDTRHHGWRRQLERQMELNAEKGEILVNGYSHKTPNNVKTNGRKDWKRMKGKDSGSFVSNEDGTT